MLAALGYECIHQIVIRADHTGSMGCNSIVICDRTVMELAVYNSRSVRYRFACRGVLEYLRAELDFDACVLYRHDGGSEFVEFIAGYMPRRGDFDMEWENEAEDMIADTVWSLRRGSRKRIGSSS